MVDFTSYVSPGVYTQSVPGPQLSVNSIGPKAIAIFGNTIGYRVDAQTITIPADVSGVPVTSVVLRQQGINTASILVNDVVTNALYALTTDYTIHSITGPSGIANSFDTTYTITRVLAGSLAAGTAIRVSFNYTNTTYYQPTSYFSFNDVRDAYGPAMDSSGNIISELTLSCFFAFQNGASQIIAVAVNPTANPPILQNYIDALAKFQNMDSVSIIVPATGNTNLFAAIRTHVDSQSLNRHERRAILGCDGSVTSVSSAARITAAQGIADARIALISPATVNFFNPTTNTMQTLGSHFLAAAVAGVNAVLPAAMPLTRKTVSGFVNVAELVGETQKDLEAKSGLMVLENTNQGGIRVRHGLTTDPTNILTREWTITGQSDAMVYQLRSYLDSDGLIGGIINSVTLPNVKASVSTALENLVNNSVILGYTDLSVRQLVSSPDIVQITFEWQPSIPLNYLVVSYSIDTTTGIIVLASSSNG